LSEKQPNEYVKWSQVACTGKHTYTEKCVMSTCTHKHAMRHQIK